MRGNILNNIAGPTSEPSTVLVSTFAASGIDAGDYIIRIGGWNSDSGTYEMTAMTFEAIVEILQRLRWQRCS